MNEIRGKEAIAMITFVIYAYKAKNPVNYKKNGQVGLPDWFPYVHNGGIECDMAKGFCSCGASHKIGESRNIVIGYKNGK